MAIWQPQRSPQAFPARRHVQLIAWIINGVVDTFHKTGVFKKAQKLGQNW
jgi:hypothetical protein